jgi:two-component sensor histidine kinase/ligand-binding sensor domain-containing protein
MYNFFKISFKVASVILLLFVDLHAQKNNTEFTNLTSDDGLPSNAITKIIQDDRGFLWLGTYNGLVRYDGYNFKIFLPEKDNPNSISSHSVRSLYVDSKGFIWVGTSDGLNKYDWKTEKFYRYVYSSKNPRSISNDYIYSIYEDKKGILWFGTAYGVNFFDPKTNEFALFLLDKTQKRDDYINITKIDEDYKGNLWIGTWNGLIYIQKDGKILKQFWHEKDNPKSIGSNQISTLFIDNENNLWIGTNGAGIDRYDRNTGNFVHYKANPEVFSTISNGYITTIYQDKLNNIWIGTKNGLNKFNPVNGKFIRFMHNQFNPKSVINNEILSICQDKTGILWIGTSGGMSKYFQPINKFHYYLYNKTLPARSLSSNRVNSVFVDKENNIWAGTLNGLDKIVNSNWDDINFDNTKETKIIHYQSNPQNPNSLTDGYVKSALEDHLGFIWIGTDGGGVNRLNPLTGEIKAYQIIKNDNESLSSGGVPSIYEDHNGTLWFGTYDGLNKFNRKTGKFHRYMSNPSNPNSIRNNIIWDIFEDSKGMFWLGTDGGGVSEFNPKTDNFKNYLDGSPGKNGQRVYSIYETSDGLMWFGTADGLNQYDRNTGKFVIYTKESGLPSNAINSIIEDDNGYLWLSTDRGLSKFDRKSKLFWNYTKRNGLNTNEFGINDCFKSKGYLFFGSSDGLLFFKPKNIKYENIKAPVVFTDLKIYNQSVPISNDGILNKSITSVENIKIPYNDNVITIEFALFDYFNVKRNEFSYKLSGFDAGWNDVGNRNSATYTNLPPGEYVFYVKAFNNYGIKASNATSLHITIVPTFFQTFWFRISLGIGLVFLTLLAFHLRTRAIKRQKKVLENKVSERTQDLDETIKELSLEVYERKKAEQKVQASLEEKEVLLKEVHHRVKNNLQVISSLLYLQSKSIKDENTLHMFNDSQNRIKSMALIHEKLYQSRDFAGINFYEYVKSLLEHLNKTFRQNDFIIKTHVDINNVKLSLDTAISCGLIVNELITNAYKYAFPNSWVKNKINGEFKIEISVNNLDTDKYIMLVSDNGIGMDDNFDIQSTESLGLKLVGSMVNQLNGSIEISINNGTQFKILFSD